MSKSLAEQAKECVGKNWSKSSLTNEKNLGNIERLMDKIEEQSGLEDLQNLKPGHIEAALAEMQAEGLSASTLCGYATAARMVAEGIGKANIVPRTNQEIGFSRAGERYNPIVSDPADRAQVRDALHERGYEHLALAADMREAFGLRPKESLVSVNVVERGGKEYLHVPASGAKGGRERFIEIRDPEQREALANVREHIDRTPGQKSLCPVGMTLKQTYDQQRNQLSAIGATKASKTNAHAARHAFVQRETAKGTPDKEIMEKVGHNRTDVMPHYRE